MDLNGILNHIALDLQVFVCIKIISYVPMVRFPSFPLKSHKFLYYKLMRFFFKKLTGGRRNV